VFEIQCKGGQALSSIIVVIKFAVAINIWLYVLSFLLGRC